MREQSANDGLLDDTTVQDAAHDTRLRILYLYQLLLTQSDEDHPLTTKQITDKMEELHGIHMHRITVPADIALLKAAVNQAASHLKSENGGQPVVCN